jgi:hypothetical protein
MDLSTLDESFSELKITEYQTCKRLKKSILDGYF